MAACRLSTSVPYCQLDDEYTRSLLQQINGDLKVDNIWIYSFYRIAQSNQIESELVNGLQTKDVVHSVAGLYASVLQSMELETIYDGLSYKDSFTIIVSSDRTAAASYLQERICSKFTRSEKENKGSLNLNSLRAALEETVNNYQQVKTTNKSKEAINDSGQPDTEEANDEETTSESENEFQLVYSSEFSDSGTESNNSSVSISSTTEISKSGIPSTGRVSINSEELNLMSGYQAFIGSCLHRKILVMDALNSSKTDENKTEETLLPLSGPEHRIMGSVTFRIRYLNETQRVVHIIFLAVRHHWRKRRLGTILLHLLKDPQVVGPYDAIVVHADTGAQTFFKRFGFTANMTVNQRWTELADEYTDCQLMTFVPGFGGSATSVSPLMPSSLFLDQKWLDNLDNEFETYAQQAEAVHCTNVFLYRKMREEIVSLKQSVFSQRKMIEHLCKELRQIYYRRLLRVKCRKANLVAIDDEGAVSVHRTGTKMRNPDQIATRLAQRIEELERHLTEPKVSRMTVSIPQTVYLQEAGASGDDDDDDGGNVEVVNRALDDDDTETFGTTSDEATDAESVKLCHESKGKSKQ